jgi:prepilin-type N-terminal cleavage/methylation domain-containing protein
MNRSNTIRQRSGFTAVELVVVIAIMLILTGLAAPTVFASLRRSQVQKGAALVADVARQAQQLAMQGLAPAGGECWGVALVHDPADRPEPYVALIYGKPTGNVRNRDLWDLPSPAPERKIEKLAGSLAVHVGTTMLRDATPTEVSWFYDWRTGSPLVVQSGALTGPASIGLRTLTYANAFGLGTDITTPVAAPSVGTEPGLVIASSDGQIRRAIQVFPSGLLEVVNVETR